MIILNKDKPQKNEYIFLDDLEKIASIKRGDLNANSTDQAKEMIRGTARSMGIEVKG